MKKLSYEELDGYIQQICTGSKLVYVEKGEGEEVPLLLQHPLPQDNRVAGYFYSKALEEAEVLGLPSIEEMERTIKARGLYTEEDTARIAELRSRVEGQRVILAKTTRVRARQDRLVEIIKQLEEQIEELELKKEISLEFTKERKAAEQKFLYLTWRGTLDLFTGKRFWETWDDFQKEPDYIFRKRVFLDHIIFIHGLKPEILRTLARSNLWRMRYTTALKTGDPLFGRPIRDYTVDQLMVLYWSHYYQSIYEMMPDDRPTESIIEDDEALDAYMKDWTENRNREAAASKAKAGKGSNQKSAWDHNETLVMRTNPMHEDIDYSDTMADVAELAGDTTLDAAPIGGEIKGKGKLGTGKRK